jgi:hypothetical protein
MRTALGFTILALGLATVGVPAEEVPIDASRVATEQVERFRARARKLPPPGEPWFELLEGRSGLLVTAPHATAHRRDGRLKGSDLGTGALAVVLGRLAGTPVIHTTWAAPSDPNFYDDSPFKDELARLLKRSKPRFGVDLHASREDRPYDVDLGTLHGRSLLGRQDLLQALTARLREAGLVRLSDNAFPAMRQATVTRFLCERGVPCVQLEINARWLRPERGPEEMERFLALARALSAFAGDVDRER